MADNNDNATLYPALTEMGILRFHEISHYSLRHDGADKDVLRINYKRAKGSLLPYSRKYKFGRSLKTSIADGGTSRMQQTYEISPFLLQAVSELDALVETNKLPADNSESADLKADLLAEIEELLKEVQLANGSADMTNKVENVRRLAESL